VVYRKKIALSEGKIPFFRLPTTEKKNGKKSPNSTNIIFLPNILSIPSLQVTENQGTGCQGKIGKNACTAALTLVIL